MFNDTPNTSSDVCEFCEIEKTKENHDKTKRYM